MKSEPIPAEEKGLRKTLLAKYDFYFEEIRKNPDAIHLIVSLADTCLALNKRKEALLYYKRALTINPRDEYVRSLIQSIFSPDEMKGLVIMPKARPFWQDLGSLFRYPLSRHGLISLFALALAGAVLNSVPLGGVFIVIIFFLPYVLPYMLSILHSSAKGEFMLPTTPDISFLWENVIRPFFMMMTALAVSFWPIVIYLLFELYAGIRLEFLIPAGVIFGIVYLPMSLLVTAVCENFLGPFQMRMVIASIWNIHGHYLVAIVAFLCWFFIEWLLTLIMPFNIFLLGHLIFWFFTLYFSTLLMRILGNIAAINMTKLAWET